MTFFKNFKAIPTARSEQCIWNWNQEIQSFFLRFKKSALSVRLKIENQNLGSVCGSGLSQASHVTKNPPGNVLGEASSAPFKFILT